MEDRLMIVECPGCRMDLTLAAEGWTAVLCPNCRYEIAHPLVEIAPEIEAALDAYTGAISARVDAEFAAGSCQTAGDYAEVPKAHDHENNMRAQLVRLIARDGG